MECREAIMAAWLMNIGRFLDEGAQGLVRRCGKVLEACLDTEKLLGILSGEPEYEAERRLAEEAFHLSLWESEASEKLAKGRNLTSVFSRVTVKDQARPQKMYYSIKKESPGAVFPREEGSDEERKKLALEFIEELRSLEHHLPESWADFIMVFDGLLRKYAWCITASDYEGEDVSLYNQSRIAGAAAACMLRSRDPEGRHFKLVVGDFSGIQNYVFSVANVSEKGVAKRLRARSFYVDVAVSAIAQDIICRFDLTQNHILMLTGGKFYLLLPNTEDSDRLLETIEREIEESFLSLFKGQIAIHLAWITMGPEGLKDYSRSVTEIMRVLGDKKSRAFHHSLTDEKGWTEDKFNLYEELAGKHVCRSCLRELTDRDRNHCANCTMQTEIGARLPRTRYLSYYRGEREGTYHIYGDYWIGLWPEFRRDGAFLTEQINGTSLPDEARGAPVKIRYMANYIPVDDQGEVMTFQDMAEAARGAKRLAVLKADVDTLGYIFADGLRTGKRHFGTISRVNTMSRFLEIFFSGYVNEVLTRDRAYRNVYSVFSGGDDLFLIGPWDVMPGLAEKISRDFRDFAAKNPALTISAAVSVFQPREHIANMAELSEKSLNYVKNHTVRELYPGKTGRDGVRFLGQLFGWEDLGRQLEIGERLARLLERKLVSTNTLKRIGTYSRMYREFLMSHDVMSLMFEPLFHYDRQRNYGELENRKEKQKDEDLRWFLDDYVGDLSENAADLRVIKKNLFFAEAAVACGMNLTKEERG